MSAKMTLKEMLEHIEELQEKGMDDTAAWQEFYYAKEAASEEEIKKADKYIEEKDLSESSVGYDIFMEYFWF